MAYKPRLAGLEGPVVPSSIVQTDPVRAAPERRIIVLDGVVLPVADFAYLVAARARLGQGQVATALARVARLLAHDEDDGASARNAASNCAAA